MLGSHVISRYPELYNAYIGVGQVANTVESEKEIYEFMRTAAIERNDAAVLEELGAWNPDDEEMYKSGSYLGMRTRYATKYGGGILRNETSVLPLLQQLFFCKAYTVEEKMNYIKGSAFSGMTMAHYVVEANLMNDLPTQDIPVYILEGRYDYQTTHKQAETYYNALEAPEKAFYTFENSAHSPMFDEPVLFFDILKNDVLG
jgi:pimeloyl-ACP methyl ester carboxylesterase